MDIVKNLTDFLTTFCPIEINVCLSFPFEEMINDKDISLDVIENYERINITPNTTITLTKEDICKKFIS